MAVYQVEIKSVSLYPTREENAEKQIRAFLKLKVVNEEKWVADGREEIPHNETITGNRENTSVFVHSKLLL